MLIDPLKEQVISLSQAARQLPKLRNDRPFSNTTIWRWSKGGVNGIRLETIRIGGRTCTSIEALGRFFAALNHAPSRELPVAKNINDEKVPKVVSTMNSNQELDHA
jgi:hypothetical protein